MNTRGQSESETDRHLTEGELFTLAVPPAGQPEALPRHLSRCLACSRALSEWKTAARDLAAEDADALSRRPQSEWDALEEATLAKIRRARPCRRRISWRWMAAAAAVLLLSVLALPLRQKLLSRASVKSAPAAVAAMSASMSVQDREDDALLRDVARLSRGDEGAASWTSLAPDPDSPTPGEKSSL